MRCLAALVFLLAAPVASAGEEPARPVACRQAHERARALRRDDRLADARAELRSCARVGCPPGLSKRCRAELDSMEEASVPMAEPKLVPTEEGPRPERIVAYTFLGLGAASLAAGFVTGGLSIQRARQLRAACGRACPPSPELLAARDEALLLAHLSTGGLALGAASLGAALTAWLLEPTGESVADKLVGVGPGGVGAVVRF